MLTSTISSAGADRPDTTSAPSTRRWPCSSSWAREPSLPSWSSTVPGRAYLPRAARARTAPRLAQLVDLQELRTAVRSVAHPDARSTSSRPMYPNLDASVARPRPAAEMRPILDRSPAKTSPNGGSIRRSMRLPQAEEVSTRRCALTLPPLAEVLPRRDALNFQPIEMRANLRASLPVQNRPFLDRAPH